MKLHHQRANIERGGVQAESTFTIKTTAKSFEILSSGLYTDPITAVIRELSCNAYDAHIAADKADVPFAIHLPNELEPYFSVADYGIGLSDDDIQGELIPVMLEALNGDMVQAVDENGDLRYKRTGGLYTTYFDSTKTDSNEFIGALGLGSKSPFSYVDAFDVTSCYDGIKNMYSIFLNENGIPSVALMGSTDTIDPNGLEIRIAVEETDFYTFRDKTASVLRYFPTPPDVTGSIQFEFVQFPKKRLEGDGWFVATKNWHTESFVAVQGNVPYRVNIKHLENDLSAEESQFLSKADVVAYFNIGDLDVAANREEIRYDKRTKAALVEKMRKIRHDLTKEIEKRADKYKHSFWEACIELDAASEELFGSCSSIRLFAKQDDTTNKILERYIKCKGAIMFDNMKQHELVKYTPTSVWRSSNQRITRKCVTASIEPTNKTVIFYNDINSGGIGRVKLFLRENSAYRDAIIITRLKNPIIESTTLKVDDDTGIISSIDVIDDTFDPNAEFVELLDQLGHPEIKIVSIDTNAIVRSTSSHSVPVFQFGGSRVRSISYYRSAYRVVWEKSDITSIDLDDGGIFFSLKHSTQIHSNGHHIDWNPSNVKENFEYVLEAINKAYDTSYTMGDVYGMSASALKQIKKKDGWHDVFDLFHSSLSVFDDSIKHASNLANTSDSFSVIAYISDKDFMDHVMELDVDSPFRMVVEPLSKSHKKFYDTNAISTFIVDFARRFDVTLPEHEAKSLLTCSDFDDYPMVKVVGSLNEYRHNWKILFDYIKLTDRN